MTLPSPASVIDRSPCARLMPCLAHLPWLGILCTPTPHRRAGGGRARAGAPHTFSLPKNQMMRIPHPDFPSWQRKTLDKFAKDANERMKELEQANEQLRRDLRDAMKLVRQKLKNES